ncbi:hypothetical protein MOK15_03460 [Sphingobium sp. BYY-5]|uniref:hypothetical protein n=1 Tax=Sphingobium sp. BYY-5 TaxID=2926400 RepID=UPI001FA712C9|nr:hypothetical protein [Sphingobium sp. BYY-5]MCI4589162.1 hypothetical protein [Sphingobium sp. BYY-5]
MMERRTGWAYRLRSRKGVDGDGVIRPVFRSDNDLYQWRYEWGLMTAATGGILAAVTHFDLAFRFWPVILLPAILLFGLSRWQAWRNRQFGKRFSHYESDQISR